MNILPISMSQGEKHAFKGEGFLSQCVSSDYVDRGYLKELLDKYFDERFNPPRIGKNIKFDDNYFNYYRKIDMLHLIQELEEYASNSINANDSNMDFYWEFIDTMWKMMDSSDRYDSILFEGP